MTKIVAQLRGGILTQNSREDSSNCKGHQFQKVVAALVTRSILTDKFRALSTHTHTLLSGGNSSNRTMHAIIMTKTIAQLKGKSL